MSVVWFQAPPDSFEEFLYFCAWKIPRGNVMERQCGVSGVCERVLWCELGVVRAWCERGVVALCEDQGESSLARSTICSVR